MSQSLPKLKIGLVVDDSLDKTDGVQQYVLTLGEWLRSQGHAVRYLTSTTRRTDISGIDSLSRNVAVRFNANRLSIPLPASSGLIKKLLERERFDVLHVQVPYSPLLAQKVIRLSDRRTVVFGTFHIVPYSAVVSVGGRLLAAWVRSSLGRFDEVVSVSSAAQDFAKRVFGINSEVVPNVIDYKRFARAAPLPKPDDKLRIVFLGRLVPRKGCLMLLKALLLMQGEATLPRYKVIVCGKGPLEVSLKRFVIVNRLQSVVSFAGFVSEADKPRYLRSADIAVFPSSGGESFGIVLIEAMAAGAAVLAGDNAGYRSVMQQQPELLFDPSSARALADKLILLLTDSTVRRQAQTWGTNNARAYDTAAVGARLLTKYNAALSKRRKDGIIES